MDQCFKIGSVSSKRINAVSRWDCMRDLNREARLTLESEPSGADLSGLENHSILGTRY